MRSQKCFLYSEEGRGKAKECCMPQHRQRAGTRMNVGKLGMEIIGIRKK